MQQVGILLLVGAVWLMYAGFEGLRPLATLLAILQDPANAGAVIDGARKAATDSKAAFSEVDAGASVGGSFGGADPSSVGNNVTASPQAFAQSQLASYGWSANEWDPLEKLWARESSWNAAARNPSSGAYGIPQALPGSKMATAGPDWLTNPQTQIKWGLQYIKTRYGSPTKAWAHETSLGWY